MLNSEPTVPSGDADSVSVAGQLTNAMSAGLPLESGLRALAAQTKSRGTRAALMALSERLEEGMPLAEALRVSESGLPRTMCVLVSAGLESGKLDHVMQYCVEQTQRAMSLRQQIWLFLAYPLFLIWFALLICGGIIMLVVPSFGKIFDDFGTELPGLTIAIVQLSSVMRGFGLVSWLAFMSIGPLLALLLVAMGTSRSGHRWATSIPLIGRVFRYAALSDLCQLLALLIDSNLPFSKALQFAGSASDDRWLNHQCLKVVEQMDQGSTPDEGARLADLPNSLVQVFRGSRTERPFAEALKGFLGNTSGSGISGSSSRAGRPFAEALRGLAEIYSAQCFVSSQLVNAIVAPFAITIVISFVGTTVIALFLPLVKLLNDLA